MYLHLQNLIERGSHKGKKKGNGGFGFEDDEEVCFAVLSSTRVLIQLMCTK